MVIEDCLIGEEASFMVLTDGKAVVPLATTQDHKAIHDGDKGPNTGGMGAYSPAPVITKKLQEVIMDSIVVPLMKALKKEKIKYRGVIYAGLMISEGKPYVLEFNCRFGDPEAQPILMRLKSDLFKLLDATVKGKLGKVKAGWKKEAAVSVVISAEGYPEAPKKGDLISGINDAEKTGAVVFHAGTACDGMTGPLLTSGGRVVGVTALGKDIATAKKKAYEGVKKVRFDGMHYRKDIADKAIRGKE